MTTMSTGLSAYKPAALPPAARRSPGAIRLSAMTALAVSIALAAPAYSDDAHHPDKAQDAKGAPAKPAAKSPDPSVRTQDAKGAPAKPAAKAPDTSVRKMQDNLKKMQGQLERIARAKTDEERRQATAEHLRTLRENMRAAHGMQAAMMGCPMMDDGTGMMGGAMPGAGMGMPGGRGMSGGPQAGGAERMHQMERRMDMMQMMMEQMLRRTEGPSPQPSK